MSEMILKYFDWSVSFLHASLQIALGTFIVCLALFLLVKVVITAFYHSRHYKIREKRIKDLESEVKRLKVNLFQMGFTDHAPIWMTVEESKDLVDLVQRIEDDTQLTNREVDVLMCLKKRIEGVDKKSEA